MTLLHLLATVTPAQTAPADTVAFVHARDSLMVATEVATVVIAVAFIVLAILAAGLLLQVRKLTRTANRLTGDVRKQLTPVAGRAQNVADNLGYVTAVIREDVDALHASVAGLTTRLTSASERVEERIEEFNALLELVQSEAEGLFIDTASTVRAVRAGARSLSETPAPSEESEQP